MARSRTPLRPRGSGWARIAASASSDSVSFTRCGPLTRGMRDTEIATDWTATSQSAAYHRYERIAARRWLHVPAAQPRARRCSRNDSTKSRVQSPKRMSRRPMPRSSRTNRRNTLSASR